MGAWIWVTPGTPQPLAEQPIGDGASEAEERGLSVDSDTYGRADGPVNEGSRGSSVAETPGTEDRPPRTDGAEPIRINVLGPVEFDPDLVPQNRPVLLELACYLALHRNGVVSTEALQMALPLSRGGGAGGETAAKTIRTYMSELRGYLGPDHVPSARGSGYRLSDLVTCDWELFLALSNERVSDRYEQMRLLSEALNLVRGRPFDGTKFRWVDAELLVSEMEGADRGRGAPARCPRDDAEGARDRLVRRPPRRARLPLRHRPVGDGTRGRGGLRRRRARADLARRPGRPGRRGGRPR